MIDGLIIIKNYISEKTEKDLLLNIEKNNWDYTLKRGTQHYIKTYNYKSKHITNATPEPDFIKNNITNKLINDYLLPSSGPEQIIINKYEPGEGISPHIDAEIFGEPIITLSLKSSTTFIFQKNDEIITFYLKPRTLVIMTGESRYLWKHSINPRKTDIINGKSIKRNTRISITYRLLASNTKIFSALMNIFNSIDSNILENCFVDSINIYSTRKYTRLYNHENNERIQTNPKYPNFFQEIYHAGDKEQFYNYITMKSRIDKNVVDTFNYLFDNFKKGIFVEINDGKLVTYLPFSNVNYENNWYKYLKLNPKYNMSIIDFQKKFFRDFSTESKYNVIINNNINKWYANNGIFRNTIYKNGILKNLDDEGDKSVKNFLNLILKSILYGGCMGKNARFFINPRDHPVLRKDMKHPYNLLYPKNKLPLLNYDNLLPIYSQSITDDFADKLIPNDDDITSSNNDYYVDWKLKINKAIFRGSATGFGVNSNSNVRLKLIDISKNNIDLIDAQLTGLNIKPKIDPITGYIDVIDRKKYKKGNYMTPEEQAQYKFIIHVQGHVAAFRLSKELSYGSVILKVDSPWKTWYSDLLKPGIHYIPVKEDLSDLVEILKNYDDKKCEEIAMNGYNFWKKYLSNPYYMLKTFSNSICNN